MRSPSQQTIKDWSRKAVLFLGGSIIAALVGQCAIAIAEEQGYYSHPTQKLKAVIDVLFRNPFVLSVGSAMLGFALGVWTYSRGQARVVEAPIVPQPKARPDPRVGHVAKARELAMTIRHAVDNRDEHDACAFYQGFSDEATDAREMLLRDLSGIPPLTRNTNASAAYWQPRSRHQLLLIWEDLILLANAVEKKLGSSSN